MGQQTCSYRYTLYMNSTQSTSLRKYNMHNCHETKEQLLITVAATYYSGYLLYFLQDWHRLTHINLLSCHWQFPVWRHLCCVQIHISIRSIWWCNGPGRHRSQDQSKAVPVTTTGKLFTHSHTHKRLWCCTVRKVSVGVHG